MPLSVGQVASELGVSPIAISSLIYRNAAIRKRCTLIAGRRQVPREMVSTIAQELNRRSASRAK